MADSNNIEISYSLRPMT